jgi:hypothetical protein
MLSFINTFIIDCSRSWWKFLLLFIGQAGTMATLNNITAQFPAVSGGNIPFDMQNNLSAADIFTQLEGYTERAFDLYMIFQAVDYLFPVVAGLLLATVCAFALRTASAKYFAAAAQKNLFVLLLVPSAFDWLENINLLWVVTAWPDQAQLAANLAVAAKIGKLSTMTLAFIVTTGLLMWAVGAWLGRRFRSGAANDQPPAD